MKSAFPISALLRSDSYSKTYINLHPSNEPFVNWKSALSFYEKKKGNYVKMDWQTFFTLEISDSGLFSPISCITYFHLEF